MVQDQRVIAIAADYADALLVARRAKRLLVLLLVVIVLAHLAVFFTAHFAPDLIRRGDSVATTAPSRANWPDLLHYVTAATLFAGLIFSILLSLVLFLTIHIMLVGRLIGVRDVTRALITSFFLLILLVPWQTLLVTEQLGRADVVPPGILYTWREIAARVPIAGGAELVHQILYWARFAALPIFGLILLLLVQVRSGRGLKYALGEEEIVVDHPVDDRAIVRDDV
jgi:hypothetical protein